MNLVLFESDELQRPLRRDDPRVLHVLETLRMGVGATFDAGVVNGARGKATIASIDAEFVTLNFQPVSQPEIAQPLDAIVGLPRPQTSRRILHDASALGIRRLTLVGTARSDPNYAASRLWSTGEWRQHLIDGAQQAFDTRLPELVRDQTLTGAADRSRGVRIALDNYEATGPLHAAIRSMPAPPKEVTLAFGPERGWATEDRHTLRAAGFIVVSLGRRVLRVETAIASAIAVVRSELGWE